ncbi:TlpA disulfide reductase family protein [Pontibacter oryzae]|uniref:TlpA family protein disulfide reductase n=1 Tax=Pontibacter oryzae TaxID=2304593 RepID=A0A399RZN9_9BACT|nr:TlpA disulfide reductase family protein [Pontibacter oryzae]RIJ37400.1 TlpA family protein disulfide reductase [Pontibacter oryzae]
MKKRILLLSLLGILIMAYSAQAQQVPVIKYDGLQKLRNQPHDTLYVVNFWATWCRPCVKELPYFEAASQRYKNQPVKVLLVSMDAVEDLDTRVKPFIKKRNMQATVLLLDEVDGNSWIDKIEPKWSGAIPATMVFNNKRGVYEFREAEMTEQELTSLIEKYK